MFGSTLKKHINEFRRYVLNNQYEQSDTGVYFPKARANMAGIYTHSVNGLDERSDHNIIPDEGLNHFLGVVLKSDTQITTWYVMLQGASSTPGADRTAANYQTSPTEATDYTNSAASAVNREVWTGDAVDTGNTEVTNDATPAAFTITGTLAVYGAAIISSQAKSAATGVLLSAGAFAATRNLVATDVFNLKYKVDLDAA